MTDLWHPDAVRVSAPTLSWGHYRGTTPYRGVLHTTETDYYPPSTSSYFGGNSWPHSTIGQAKDGTRGIFQHIPINRAARALKNKQGGVETNAAHAVQCEIVWRAANAAAMPEWLLVLVESWMRFAEAAVGINRTAVPFFGQGAGFIVASENAPQRMTPEKWNAYSGWCGHQHVPENDHWDPGAIPIDRLIGGMPPHPTPQPQPDEDEGMLIVFADKTGADQSQVLALDGKLYIIDEGTTAAGIAEGGYKTLKIGATDYQQMKAKAEQ